MAKNVFKSNILGVVSLLVVVLVVGCSSSKTNYQREYTRVWKELIKTEAWKNSLLTKNNEKPSNEVEYYASSTETGIVEDQFSSKMNMEVLFDKRFYSLTSRAYVKIISEAENANNRLKAEYDRWNSKQQNPDLKRDKAYKKDYEMVNKKYHAHEQMLEGLKSWNIFSEFRSNDLDFFRAENRDEIRKMYQNGSTEENMINYLVYRLADLYHYEDQ